MLFWICQQIVLSIILILSLHYSYLFFKNNLTIPKTIDMIKKPVGQYKDIYNSIKKNKQKNENMKNELKNYLKNLSTKKNETPKKTPEIVQQSNVFDTNNFSTF
tara:strand:- start:2342 stop:2653 length:312 start_codon:yes stop_codon:yes gene_type:complete